MQRKIYKSTRYALLSYIYGSIQNLYRQRFRKPIVLPVRTTSKIPTAKMKVWYVMTLAYFGNKVRISSFLLVALISRVQVVGYFNAPLLHPTYCEIGLLHWMLISKVWINTNQLTHITAWQTMWLNSLAVPPKHSKDSYSMFSVN